MYDNIGGKIKSLATFVMVVEAIAAVVSGFGLIATDEDFILPGVMCLILGPIVAWVSSWLLYGFGEIIDHLDTIAGNSSYGIIKEERRSIIKPASSGAAVSNKPGAMPGAPVAGEWVCTCGKVHKDFESSCVCGVTKREAKLAQKN